MRTRSDVPAGGNPQARPMQEVPGVLSELHRKLGKIQARKGWDPQRSRRGVPSTPSPRGDDRETQEWQRRHLVSDHIHDGARQDTHIFVNR